jgi:hypothetical protein
MGFSLHAHAVIVSAPLGVFLPSNSMADATYDHTATALPNGLVLITDTSSAQLFDPTTGSLDAAGTMNTQHAIAAATLLNTGQVLIAGTSFPDNLYPSAELYDPSSNSFTVTGDMAMPRYGASAVALQDGRVLIVGGRPPGTSSTPIQVAEVFDPASGTFKATGSQVVPRFGATTSLLPSGDVLIAGGTDGAGHVYFSAEIYRAAQGTFAATGNMGSYRVYHSAAALPDGRVLITGGYGNPTSGSGTSQGVILATAEIYDEQSGRFTAVTAAMSTSRQNHTSTVQHDGSILLTGGQDDYANVLPYGEVYRLGAGTFTRIVAHMVSPRTAQVATMLPDGRTLVSGGENYNANYSQLIPLASMEIYAPDQIFHGAFEGNP